MSAWMHCIARFDVELAKVNDALKSEKQLRDKLQRERDELAAEKYSADQELKVLMASCFMCLVVDICQLS